MMQNNTEVHRFSDISKSFRGPSIKVPDILNQEITILYFTIKPSKIKEYESGDCAWVQIEMDGKPYVLFTASKVIRSLLTQYSNELPFKTVIKKQKEFYTFT